MASDSDSSCAGLALPRGTWQSRLCILKLYTPLHLKVRLCISLCYLRSALELARLTRWWFIIFLAKNNAITNPVQSPSCSILLLLPSSSSSSDSCAALAAACGLSTCGKLQQCSAARASALDGKYQRPSSQLFPACPLQQAFSCRRPAPHRPPQKATVCKAHSSSPEKTSGTMASDSDSSCAGLAL